MKNPQKISFLYVLKLQARAFRLEVFSVWLFFTPENDTQILFSGEMEPYAMFYNETFGDYLPTL